MIGPVEEGFAMEVVVPEKLSESEDEAVVFRIELAIEEDDAVMLGVEFATEEEDECKPLPNFEYILRRFGPPQYSVAFPLQIMLHCVVAGVLPGARVLPPTMEFPQ